MKALKHHAKPRPAFARAVVSRFLAASLAVGAVAAGAQTVDLQPIQLQRDINAMLEVDGFLFAGMDGGGLAVVPVDNPSGGSIWTAGADLSGNNVVDMVWTGEHLWIATEGAGLTRIADPTGTRSSGSSPAISAAWT